MVQCVYIVAMTTLTSFHSIEGIAADLCKKLAVDTLKGKKKEFWICFLFHFLKTVVSLIAVHGHRWILPTQTQTTFEEHAVGESYSPNGRGVVREENGEGG